MQRVTKPQPGGGYALLDGHEVHEAIDRLGRYEDMLAALLLERDKAVADMEKLKAQGKNNTVTYKQLWANKMTLMNLISRIKLYQ